MSFQSRTVKPYAHKDKGTLPIWESAYETRIECTGETPMQLQLYFDSHAGEKIFPGWE